MASPSAPAEIPETRAPVPGGTLGVWFAVLGGIAAWTLHVLFLASWSQHACNEGGLMWASHLMTGVTGAVTVTAMALSYRLVRAAASADEGDPTSGGWWRFLGLFGLLTGSINLLLIILEGAFVAAIGPCS